MLRAWFEIALWKRILLALVAGVLVGCLPADIPVRESVIFIVALLGIAGLGDGSGPLRRFRGAREVMIVGFSTSSSSATMPVTLSVAERNLGIRPVVATVVANWSNEFDREVFGGPHRY